MSARDELVDLMRENRIVWATNTEHRQSQTAQADAILAAGYTKPRTITTAEELDALPFESVIRDADGHVLERWEEVKKNCWATVMVGAYIPRGDIALPATVLYEPAA